MKTFTRNAMAIFALETAGGINIAADAISSRGTNVANYGKERILAQAGEIDVYLAQKGTMNQPTIRLIKTEPGFHLIKAVRENQVFIINEMIVSRPTPRLLEGVLEIGRCLYPKSLPRLFSKTLPDTTALNRWSESRSFAISCGHPGAIAGQVTHTKQRGAKLSVGSKTVAARRKQNEDIMTNPKGVLYGLGVGPGDPELITLKAAGILSRVDVVYAAGSTKNDHSLAVQIAGPHIPEHTPVKMLRFPMTADKAEKQRSWEAHARTIINEMEQGLQVAFITLGDSMTYSTYGYLLKTVQALAPHLDVVSVPGITSYQAAAAAVNRPLVEGEESLLLISGVEGGASISAVRRLCGKCRFSQGL